MSREGVPFDQLPAHVQQSLKKHQLGGMKIGPDSPLLGLDRPRRKRLPGQEHLEQVSLFEWIDDPATLKEWPELDCAYSIPNESFGAKDGAEKKARGRRKGMPDCCLPVARRAPDGSVYGNCFIEMKRMGGSVQESQQERIAKLRARGNFVEIALSAASAKALLLYYLRLAKPANLSDGFEVLRSSEAKVGRWKVQHAPKKIEGRHPWDPGCYQVFGSYDDEADARRIADAFNAIEADGAA